MYTNKLKTLALCALPFAALASPSAQATTTINVAVAANFTSTVGTLISAFKATYPGTDVSVTSDSSSVLQGQIINQTAVYDLFLSADQTRPQQLATSYPALVSGSPFKYAVGELELWSLTTDISAGLPSTLTTDLVLADPNKAPYGTAAAQVLSASPWSVTWPANPYPVSGTAHVFTKSNISLTYSAIKTGAYAYGFIAQSSICKLVGGVKTFSSGYHYTYPYNVAPTHNRIEQYAIQVVNSGRTSAQDTVLANFINFLTVNSTGTGIVQSYCYSLT
jgi:molybdate transport system substrate-binding protein